MNKPLKILSLVSYKFLPPQLGGQKGIALFNRYLCRHIDLMAVTIKDNTESETEPYPVQNILSGSPLRYINPFYFFSLQKLIKKEGITHLLLEHPYYGWLGIFLKWFCRIKLVVHSHNIESLRFKSMNKWWWGILWHYEKFVHRQAGHSFFIHADDMAYAIKNFRLNPESCTVITYGFDWSAPPSTGEKQAARERICREHNVKDGERILLFNGTLGYKPNLDALDIILNKINPLLQAEQGFGYRIIICGSKLPAQYKGLVDYTEKNIIYAGFVADIDLYFKGCDIFINPVIEGGGIKTKVVEALGHDLSVISTASGAIGIPADITGGKLTLVIDNNWNEFARAIVHCDTTKRIPGNYFNHFYWDNIAAKAATAILKMA